jgi:hypothetical protein
MEAAAASSGQVRSSTRNTLRLGGEIGCATIPAMTVRRRQACLRTTLDLQLLRGVTLSVDWRVAWSFPPVHASSGLRAAAS